MQGRTVTEPANHCYSLIYREDGIVIVPAPQNIVTIVTAEFLPPVARFLANKGRTAHILDYAEEKRLWAVSEPNRARIYYRQKPHGISRQSIGIAAVNFQDRFHCRRKQRHLKEPLRFTSDGNADRRMAWLRRFPEVFTFNEIRGCRCTCFRLWHQKQDC